MQFTSMRKINITPKKYYVLHKQDGIVQFIEYNTSLDELCVFMMSESVGLCSVGEYPNYVTVM